MIIKIKLGNFDLQMLRDAKENKMRGNRIDEGTLGMLGDILLDNYDG